jgi:hypothetical protein
LILKTYIELQEAKKINDAVDRLLEENGFKKSNNKKNNKKIK